MVSPEYLNTWCPRNTNEDLTPFLKHVRLVPILIILIYLIDISFINHSYVYVDANRNTDLKNHLNILSDRIDNRLYA